MVFRIFKQVKEYLYRKTRRALLSDPEKMPQRYAIIMTSVLLISIIITYNFLFEKKAARTG